MSKFYRTAIKKNHPWNRMETKPYLPPEALYGKHHPTVWTQPDVFNYIHIFCLFTKFQG